MPPGIAAEEYGVKDDRVVCVFRLQLLNCAASRVLATFSWFDS